MKVRVRKSVRFQEPTEASNRQHKADWRELLRENTYSSNSAHIALQEEDSNLVESQSRATENDDREEWLPAGAKVTVIQRDAPPQEEDDISVNEGEVVVEVYLAVAKRIPNRGVGISFTRADANSPLCIDHITSHGPLSFSDLESGMVVSAINGKYMTWSSPEDALDELEKEPTMIVSAEFAPEKYYCKEYTMILEANMENYFGDYGVTFDRKGENFPLFVKEVKEDGPFSDLLPGLKVIAIDDQFMAWESPETAQEALDSIQDSVKCITVEATTEMVNTTLHQVDLEMTESKEVIITQVISFSKKCSCDLREGMKVIMLNGQVCSEASSLDELTNHAGTMWDIIAADLNCRRVLANQDSSPGEAMLAYCGAGALGVAALSLGAIDVCTHQFNTMITRQSAIGEAEGAATRQFLLPDEDAAARDADEAKNIARMGNESTDPTTTSPTATEERPTESIAQDRITIFSQNAKADENEAISQQAESSSRATFSAEPVATRSLLDIAASQSNETDDVPMPATEPIVVRSESKSGSRRAILKPVPIVARSSAFTGLKSKATANEAKSEDAVVQSPRTFFSGNEPRTSFEFKLDVGKVEKAPTTMHTYKIRKICNEDVGLKLAQGQNGGIYIAAMLDHCKFWSKGMKPGLRIAKINDVDCPSSMRVTTSLINAVDGPLTLMTTFGAKPKARKRPQIIFSSYQER